MTEENQQGSPIEEESGYGTPTVEQEMPGGDAAVPSSEAEMDSANTEEPGAGQPSSSEPGQDAAGLPDGSGTDLPESKSPQDGNDDESFDAG
ncbi:MAG: hypothetical protein JWO49_578 [Arthrobacter sp.]|nr:hypothetical protein [Arthrobacter sp.]MCU1548688.1 hypothetical protein [Arthrobacter sp.]